jgi:hypothetical protein
MRARLTTLSLVIVFLLRSGVAEAETVLLTSPYFVTSSNSSIATS